MKNVGVRFSQRLAQIFMFILCFANFAAFSTQPDLLGDWPTFGNGPAHSGYFPGNLNGLPFVLKWKSPVPANIISQPAVGGGRVYVSARAFSLGNPTLTVRALDANTGEPVWTNVISGATTISPLTYDSDAVYYQYAANPSYLQGLDAATGSTNWATSFDSQLFNYMAPVVAGGRVFTEVGHVHGLASFDQASGTPGWFVELNGNEEWAPAYYNGNVYSWTWPSRFTERNPVNGATNWSVTAGLSGDTSRRTVAIVDDRAYFIGDKLYCVNLATKANEWAVNGSFKWTPAVANGIVYAISNQYISAFTTNGVFVRQFGPTTAHGEHYGPLIVTDDVLIAVSTTGVYIYRLADGSVQQEISSYDLSCFCYRSATIGLANNSLYISSGDQNVYAYVAAPTALIRLTSAAPAGSGNFKFNFTNTPGATFTAWASTNVMLPRSNWTALGYVTQFSAGQYQFRDLEAASHPRRYYRISSP